MLVNVQGSRTDKTIVILSTAPYQFYLTGSRFFGDFQSQSDWDFFVKDSPDIRNFLMDKGLVASGPDSYADSNTVGLFALQEDITQVNGTKTSIDLIHVQLVRDADKKHEIQELIRKSFLLTFFKQDKGARKRFWNLCYALHGCDSILRSGYDWCTIHKVQITDPDGWRADNTAMERLITEADFLKRKSVSSCISVMDK